MVEPKKFVLEAAVMSALPPVSVVANRLVEVAFVVVAFPLMRFVVLSVVTVPLVLKKSVLVALLKD